MNMHVYAWTYSPGQQANVVPDPKQQLISATSYQYTVIFSNIHSILLRAQNSRHWNYRVSVNEL